MAHADLSPLRWSEYLLIKALTLIEGFALSVLPRGELRRRLPRWVDRLLEQIHANQYRNSNFRKTDQKP